MQVHGFTAVKRAVTQTVQQLALVDRDMTRTRYEFEIRDDENKAQLGGIRYGIRDKNVVRNFVLCEFQNRNSNTLFSLCKSNLFHLLCNHMYYL